MKNKNIVFANQKGGVGKSTLCILFANYLAAKGKDVCIIDTDLQKTILMQRRKDKLVYEGEEELCCHLWVMFAKHVKHLHKDAR